MVSGAGSKWNLVPLQHGKAKRARQVTASTQLSPPISTLYSPWSSEINDHQFFFIHECHPLSFGFDELDHFCLFVCLIECVMLVLQKIYGCHRFGFSESLIGLGHLGSCWSCTGTFAESMKGHGTLRTNHQDKRGQKDTQSQKRRHLPLTALIWQPSKSR